MLNDIEVLDQPDTELLDSNGLSNPDTPRANVEPGQTDFRLVRSAEWFRVHHYQHQGGRHAAARAPTLARE